MTRALSLTCAALLLVGLGGSVAFAAKPSIAVLGLEVVVDPNGAPTLADTQAAKELSDGLRARAKAGGGPYQLAPATDKELIDLKLLNNCDNEALACMSAIGNQLGADILMYGRLEKQGKSYQVSVKVIDVDHKANLKNTVEQIPVGEASGASLQGWAKKIYAKLTGEVTTLVVRVSNADRGTILIEGDPKGTISNGTGTVTGLSEGRVRVGVESEGFRRWEKDVTISAGSTATVQATLEQGGGEPDPGPAPGPGPEPGHEGGSKRKVLWGSVAAGGLLIAGFGGYWWYHNYQIIKDVRTEQCANGVPNECTPAMVPPDVVNDYKMNKLAAANKRGDDARNQTWVGAITLGVGATVAVIGIYKLATSSTAKREHAARGKRVRKDRPFVVTPIMAPDGGGATLRIDW